MSFFKHLKTTATFLGLLALLAGCQSSSLPVSSAPLGSPANWEQMLAVIDQPGPIEFEKHLAAHWAVPLSGLLNLEHPAAVAAGLQDTEEPIEIYVYQLRHPEHGTYLVDTGMSERFTKPAENDDVSFLVRSAMNVDALRVVSSTADIARQANNPIAGVFLTHIHLDHIMGLRDLPAATPVYIGPGDATLSTFMNLFTQGTTDRLLGSATSLLEWDFAGGTVLDVFGDGSLWAIHSPGHTPGATAYLARTTEGPQLMLGDVTHTRWGWNNGVEPGTFSEDVPRSVVSLRRMKKLAAAHPGVQVHPGHQSLTSAP